jgi:TrmH family RNA methyltransferase
LEAVFFCPAWFSGQAEGPLLRALHDRGVTLFELSRAAFARLSYRERPDGLVAVGDRVGVELAELPRGPRALLLVAEALEKPGNLGALLRSADGAGADGVVVCDPATDVSNPNVVRASMGALFAIPVATADTAAVQGFLADAGFRIVTAVPDAPSLYWDVDLTGRTALVIGAEHAGLSEAWLALPAATAVRLPMAGAADSLNAAAAATVLLYESVRQRRIGIRPRE